MIQDLHEECGKYGQLARVIVPRPPVPASAMELFGSNNYGKVGVQRPDIRLLCSIKFMLQQLHDSLVCSLGVVHGRPHQPLLLSDAV